MIQYNKQCLTLECEHLRRYETKIIVLAECDLAQNNSNINYNNGITNIPKNCININELQKYKMWETLKQ